ncbi:MAG TPA: cation:proton antiporter [Acidobacteriota bacterium]|nr:cation:proton antiporter [Acidobacteriota bacterium]
MEEFTLLKDLTVIFAVAVAVVALLHRLKIPLIAGFIVAGVLVGPKSLRLVGGLEEVNLIAEVGVILLLFGIGLELSLDRIKRLLTPILVGGGLQVAITGGAAFALALAFGARPPTAVFIGFIFAVSSTAIVLRGLQDRGEIDSPHGRLTLGILLFQDMCVVLMILVIPILAGSGSSDPLGILTTLAVSAAVIASVLFTARLVVPVVFDIIAGTRQRELFLLTVFLVCIGTAWVVSLAGIKLALGAFLAGVVVAGSHYSRQALADIIPFRQVFTSVFFISIGMLLDPVEMLADYLPITGILVLILLGKALVVFLVSSLMHLPIRVSILSAASLAQVGEFSFVLMQAAGGTGLLPPRLESNIAAAVILSMLITPLAMQVGPRLVVGAMKMRALNRFFGVPTCRDAAKSAVEGHVIIAGYGFTGEEMARAVHFLGIPYLIVDLNTENVRKGMAAGRPIFLGDVTSIEVLENLGIASARELVIAINDTQAKLRSIAAARRAASGIHIAVRARYLAEVEAIFEAGADEVVVAEVEAAAQLAKIVLARYGADKAALVDKVPGFKKTRGEGGRK